MNTDFFKTLSSAMDTVEENKNQHFYLPKSNIAAKAQKLYYDFVLSGINAKIDYYPAYMQIVVSADTNVLDIQTAKHGFLFADTICIDSTSCGTLHIECLFNNAFTKGGAINE